jgi:curved DNA-binding protein CbpA
MLLKKPTTALCPSSGVLSAFGSPTPITPPCRLRDRRAIAPSPGRPRQHRSYASVHDDKPKGSAKPNASDHEPKWPTSANPTPYEILGQARDTPYSKSHYFKLAKLYHPDRQCHTSGDGIPHLTKLERYRLVVAANAILSNPQKKRMYDTYGFGWENQTDSQTRHREADRAWRQEPGNPSMNGTWEDWERWHRTRNGKGEKQEQVFGSNIGFMAIISAFLIVGTWSRMTRAGTNSTSVLDMQDEKNAALSKQLQERRNQRVQLDRGGRVENFLRQREYEKWAYDPPGHGLPAPDGNKPSD